MSIISKMNRFFKKLFCGHKNVTFKRNVYGDEINFLNARSVWKCLDCNGYTYKKDLYEEHTTSTRLTPVASGSD